MNMTRALDASIQAVSPVSGDGGASVEGAGLAVSAIAPGTDSRTRAAAATAASSKRFKARPSSGNAAGAHRNPWRGPAGKDGPCTRQALCRKLCRGHGRRKWLKIEKIGLSEIAEREWRILTRLPGGRATVPGYWANATSVGVQP